MHTAKVTLKSISAYSQSRQHTEEKLNREGYDDYEERTWRSKMHRNKEGQVFMPQMGLKQALTNAARRSGDKIPGKRGATYTKHFEGGVLVIDPPLLYDHSGRPILAVEVAGLKLSVNADGKRGSGKRVWRIFPDIAEWQANVTFTVLDDVVTKDVFRKTLDEAGAFVGVGRFRPENGGYYGRFEVVSLEWI